MILAPEDAALFYRAWGALLTWVNDQRRIIPQFPQPTPDHPIDASLVAQIMLRVRPELGLQQSRHVLSRAEQRTSKPIARLLIAQP